METKTLELKCVTCENERWKNGELIQKVFPELDANTREFMISGQCGQCFDEAWEEDYDAEDDGSMPDFKGMGTEAEEMCEILEEELRDYRTVMTEVITKIDVRDKTWIKEKLLNVLTNYNMRDTDERDIDDKGTVVGEEKNHDEVDQQDNKESSREDNSTVQQCDDRSQ